MSISLSVMCRYGSIRHGFESRRYELPGWALGRSAEIGVKELILRTSSCRKAQVQVDAVICSVAIGFERFDRFDRPVLKVTS